MTCAKCTELVTQLSQAVAAQEKMAVRESELENEVEYWHKLWQRASLALLDKVDTATTERITALQEALDLKTLAYSTLKEAADTFRPECYRLIALLEKHTGGLPHDGPCEACDCETTTQEGQPK